MQNILHCYSTGGTIGRRYSALNATFRTGVYKDRTIEDVYQLAKRDAAERPLGRTARECKGKPAPYFFIAGKLYPAHEVQQPWYRMLWSAYFKENPALLREACQYDGFFDKYEGRGAKVYTPLPGYVHGEKVAQSAAIASLVYELKYKKPYKYPPCLLEAWKELRSC